MRTTTSPRPVRRVAALAAVALVALAACGGGDDAPKTLSGFVSEPLPTVSGPTLPDASNGGADFEFVAPKDGLLLLNFGYTNCPDVCPTTLYDEKKALEQIGPELAARVQSAMVTIDPDRDTDEGLTGYVQSFIADGHALRTDDPDRLAAAAEDFGVSYSVTTAADGTIEVTHTPNVFVIDDQGRLVVTWMFGTGADNMANDIRILLDRVSKD